MEYLDYRRKIPIKGEYDVVVIGGGTAGVPAAVTSARNNLKTLIIEKNGFFGGMSTAGLVGPFMTSYDVRGKERIIRGIFDEVIKRLIEKGGAIDPQYIRAGTSYTSFLVKGHDHVTPFNHKHLKIVWDEMLRESGCECLLHTHFVDAIRNGNNIESVIIHNKSGLQAIKAKTFIDCSGDADLATVSGARVRVGNGTNKEMQPATMFFRIDNVNTELIRKNAEENKEKIRPFYGLFSWILEDAKKKGTWDIQREEICMFEGVESGDYRINTTRINDVDPTNPEDLTAAEMEGRVQAWKVYKFLKENIPGCENARFVESATTVGFRESRHITGEYELNKDDILNGRIFEDRILLSGTSIDIHTEEGVKGGGIYLTVQNGDYFTVPYRALVPIGIDNLIVAGKCISASKEAFAAIRMMPCCIAMGEAAGVAAGIAIEDKKAFRDIDVNLLKRRLADRGAELKI
jgi:hypothetical protein